MSEITQTLKDRVDAAAQTASWPTATPRFFALDYDGGSDTNAGFSDVSMTAAGAVAKKTWEGIQAILPSLGAGRSVEIAIKSRAAGATYLNLAAAVATLDLTSFSNYSTRLSVRGTATDTTASSVAFADDVNDQIFCGAQRAPGTNVDGYRLTKTTNSVVDATNAAPVVVQHDGAVVFTTGERVRISGASDADNVGLGFSYLNATAGWIVTVVDGTHFSLDNSDGTTFASMAASGGTITKFKLVKADGSAAALPADTVTRGWRLRGDIANTTVSSRNAIYTVFACTTDTIVFPVGDEITTAPNPTTDFYYIENPGVAFNIVVGAGTGNLFRIAGMRSVTATVGAGGMSGSQALFSFCEFNTAPTFTNSPSITSSSSWINASSVTRTVGGGLKVLGGTLNLISLSDCSFTNCMGVMSVILTNCLGYAFSSSTLSVITINRSGSPSPSVGIGAAPNIQTSRLSRITSRSSNGFLSNLQWEGNAVVQGMLSMIGNSTLWLLDRIYDSRSGSFANKGAIYLGDFGASLATNVQVGYLGRTVWTRAGVDLDIPGSDNLEVVLLVNYAFRSRDITFEDMVDPYGNRVFLANFAESFPERIPNTKPGLPFECYNDAVADIGRYKVVRVTSLISFGTGIGPSQRMVGAAKADSVANVSGELLVARNSTFNDGGAANGVIAAHASGPLWVISDDLPAPGDMMYVSPTNEGNITKTTPAVSGTNQKRRVGIAIDAVLYEGVNMVLLHWQPEKLSSDADGNP